MHASRRAFMATAAAAGILGGAPGLAQAQAAGDARLAVLLTAFADEMIEAIRAFLPRYPTRQAVTLPALHVVNERLRRFMHPECVGLLLRHRRVLAHIHVRPVFAAHPTSNTTMSRRSHLGHY